MFSTTRVYAQQSITTWLLWISTTSPWPVHYIRNFPTQKSSQWKDAVVLPPKSAECNEDIRLYAQTFDGWLLYETYVGKPYSAKETVNLFNCQLSGFCAPAVSRTRRFMDTWNSYANNVPEPLWLTSLPNTIECYMAEESGTGYVRRVMSHSSWQN